MSARRAPWPWLAIAAVGVVVAALPLFGLLLQAPWARLPALLGRPSAQTALRLSLGVSTAAALIDLALGVPLAWLLARGRFPGQTVVRALVVLPLVLPPVVGGVGLLAVLGRRGAVGALLAPLGLRLAFTPAAAVLAAAFVSLPLVVLAVEAGLRGLDPLLEDAAAVSGAGWWRTLHQVTLPQLRGPLAAGLALAWARALGEFGATITFAGNVRGRTQTLPLAVFEVLQTDPDGAIALSLVLVALSVVVLVALRGQLRVP